MQQGSEAVKGAGCRGRTNGGVTMGRGSTGKGGERRSVVLVYPEPGPGRFLIDDAADGCCGSPTACSVRTRMGVWSH
jgi:hypothetical protein